MVARIFKVLLTQTGESKPEAIITENTTGNYDPVFQRETDGTYTCSHNELGFGKAAVLFGPAIDGVITMEPVQLQSNILRFKTHDLKTGKAVDGKLKDTFLQVELHRHL